MTQTQIHDGLLYKSFFDIDDKNMVCHGEIKIIKDNNSFLLTLETDGIKSFECDFSIIKEFKITAHVGCGTLEAEKKDGELLRLCRFTQSCINPLSEFIKAVNFYILTGDYVEVDYNADICPKCGRHYVERSTICINCANKGSIVKRFLDLSKKYIPALALAGLLIMFANVIGLAIPMLNRNLVDNYLTPATQGLAIPFNAVRDVVLIVLLMFVCYLAERVLNIISGLISNNTSARFVDHLRTKLYNKIQLLSMTSVSRRTTGDLIKRVTEDTSVIAEFIRSEIIWMLEIGIVFLGVSTYFIITRPMLALFVFLPVPIVLFTVNKFWDFIHRRYERQWITSSYANGILHDIVRGIRVVKIFGTEDKEVAKFQKANKNLADISSSNEKVWSILFPMLNFVMTAGEYLILYFGAKAVLGDSIFGNNMTLGELLQVIAYTGYIYGPLRWITWLPRSIANAVTSMAKLNEILDEDPEIRDRENAQKLDIKGDIAFSNVTFGYKSYEPVLKNISLDIKQGEMIGIVGHSGVGKSTLINLIMRLYDVNSGQLMIDGVDIRDISKETLCNSIGVVFQETFLFAGSIYDNIAYAKPEAKPEEIFAAAKIAYAHEFIIKLPDAYNTLVGENGHTLSGGERQRLAIARAILRNPKILILDEATASLDTETESKIQEAMQKLIKGRTTLAIAHRLSTLKFADRLIVLEKGNLAEIGSHEELLKAKGIYYNLVMAQRQTTKMANKE